MATKPPTSSKICGKSKLHVIWDGLSISTFDVFRDSVDGFDEVAGVHEIPCLTFDELREYHKNAETHHTSGRSVATLFYVSQRRWACLVVRVGAAKNMSCSDQPNQSMSMAWNSAFIMSKTPCDMCNLYRSYYTTKNREKNAFLTSSSVPSQTMFTRRTKHFESCQTDMEH